MVKTEGETVEIEVKAVETEVETVETEVETVETVVETMETEVETVDTDVEMVEMEVKTVCLRWWIRRNIDTDCRNGGGGGDGGNGGGGGDGGNGGNGGSIDGCVIDCSLEKYLPHPSDCRKFIQCAPYGPEEMPCAPGTVWNQQKPTCDHEWASPCVTGSYLTPEGLPYGGGSNRNGGGNGEQSSKRWK
ncbi:RNA-binding protein Raly-like [Penaeus monodon]|uniref:RNA-binding protein Raly-like n=1 Tax=Penaeus monodon TaxID=6687 RepID=UPI0018A751C9|nr:RNA-binding protein Raly-like [Penaeus monodon]